MNTGLRSTLKLRLACAIASHRMRRIIGPDWVDLANEIAENVIVELGVQECCYSLASSLREENDENFKEHRDELLRRGLADFIARNTPTQSVDMSERINERSLLTTTEIRALMITKFPRSEHDHPR